MSASPAKFKPSRPLRRSEFHVDFASIKAHIDEQRLLVERAGARFLGRLLVLTNAGIPTQALELEMSLALEKAIDRTVAFGFVTAQQEISRMRGVRLAAAPLPRGYKFPDAGRHGSMARTMAGTYRIVSMRARVTAASVVQQAVLHRQDVRGPAIFAKVELHRCALGCVGEALNLGRAAGARNYGRADRPELALADAEGPPEFAMRSEALDERTCSECDAIHGEVVQVESSDYWDLMPPAYCEGGDRCRGVYVFEDGPHEDLRGPSNEPGPQPDRPELAPVSLPGTIDQHPQLSYAQTQKQVAIARKKVAATKAQLAKAGTDVQTAARLEAQLRRDERELQRLRESLGVKNSAYRKAPQAKSTPLSGADADRRLRDFYGPVPLDANSMEALDFYQGSGYSPVNSALRGLSDEIVEGSILENTIEGLDAAMRPMPDSVIVYRSVSANAVSGAGELTGREITDPAFMSTSTSKELMGHFGNQPTSYVLELEVPRGTRGFYLPSKDAFRAFEEEKELLLARGTTFMIESVTEEIFNGVRRRVLHARVVSQ